MGWDIAFIGTGNGGDITMNGQDFAVYLQDENEIFFRLFGGNIEADTRVRRAAGEEDFSYWANSLLFGNNPATWFNSLTERTLQLTALNSSGRVTIENAIKKDLEGLEVEVTVEIVSTDKAKVFIKNIVTGKTLTFIFTQNAQAVKDFAPGDFDPFDFN